MCLSRRCFLVLLGAVCFYLEVASSSVAVDMSKTIINAPAGKIQGKKEVDTVTGESYVTFKGIPYAKAPIGNLRFLKPQPHPRFDCIFDASKDDNVRCVHPDIFVFGTTIYTEDCLLLNIHTRESTTGGQILKKVLVFVHGGLFIRGGKTNYDPKTFVQSQNVIVVTINYRLGVLGFLSTENEASPGNYGLWDLVLALRWVKDNIKAFGGDPNDVTISGKSAGGSAVGLLTLSPRTRGLFSKVFQQSASVTSVFVLSKNARKDALEVAKAAGCWKRSTNYSISFFQSEALISCLRKVPVSSLSSYNNFLAIERPSFTPRVDGDLIPKDPSYLLNDDVYLDSIGFFKRKYLIGLNNMESSIVKRNLAPLEMMILNDNSTSIEEKQTALQDLYTKAKNAALESRFGENAINDNDVISILSFYERMYPDLKSAVVKLVSDLNFFFPLLEFARAASRREESVVYLFFFNHFPSYMKGDVRGIAHILNLAYWFDFSLSFLESFLKLGIDGDFDDADVQLKKSLSSMIGSFARTGNPVNGIRDKLPSGWPKFDAMNGFYLDLSPKPYIGNHLWRDLLAVWLEALAK